MRKFILFLLIVPVAMKSFTQTGTPKENSLYYVSYYTKNLEDSGYQIISLNIAPYPFKLNSVKIDDFLANAYTGAKIFVKGIAILSNNKLGIGKLSIESKDKNDLDREKNKETHQELRYRKSGGKQGESIYIWDMDYIPLRSFSNYHEIFFFAEPEVKAMEGSKDIGIVPIVKEQENNDKTSVKKGDQLILIIYRKASKRYI